MHKLTPIDNNKLIIIIKYAELHINARGIPMKQNYTKDILLSSKMARLIIKYMILKI